MLYKKYHRNYVKQFRSGIKFEYKGICRDIVVIEPSIIDVFTNHYEVEIQVIGKFSKWTLVFPEGRIDYKIKIKKDVI